MLLTIYQNSLLLWTILIVLATWSIIWTGIGLWYAARNQQKVWFIAMLIINSVGIFPIIYILFFRKDKSQKEELQEIPKEKVKKKAP